MQDLKDLANLRLVNKLFDDVVSPAFFKGAALVTISVPDGSNSRDADSVERLLPLANNPHLRHVRDITFEGISGARAERIVDGMHAQMPLLEAFAWVNGSPPSSMSTLSILHRSCLKITSLRIRFCKTVEYRAGFPINFSNRLTWDDSILEQMRAAERQVRSLLDWFKLGPGDCPGALMGVY